MPIEKLFQSISQSPSAKGALSGAASGAFASLLMHPKSRKKLGSTALKVGGAAALAGVGYLAYQKWQRAQSGAAAGVAPAQTPPAGRPDEGAEPLGLSLSGAAREVSVTPRVSVALLKAMILAASADGHVDEAEMEALMMAMEEAGLSAEESRDLTAALNRPPALEEVAALADTPEVAAELYGAALSAIDPDSPAEHFFLRRFAKALGLAPELVSALHQTAAEAGA